MHETTVSLLHKKAIRLGRKAHYTTAIHHDKRGRCRRASFLDRTENRYRTGPSCDRKAAYCTAASFRIRHRKVTRSMNARNYCSGWPALPGHSAEARWWSGDFRSPDFHKNRSPDFHKNPHAYQLACPRSASPYSACSGAE